MDKFVVRGGQPLYGTVPVSGAKNASLALMPATLLASGISVLKNTPELNDVFTMSKMLNQLGAQVQFTRNELTIDTAGVNNYIAPYELVKKMRASIYVLGPLLARYGYAKVSLPGGCAWGPRPVDLHISAMKRLGAEVEFEDGYIIAKADRLHGARLNFDKPSVGATCNALMAAVLAKGETILNNAAMEPEVTNLVEFLRAMGAKIYGDKTSILEIEGVDSLRPAKVTTISDRIEAGTLLAAGVLTRGKITLQNSDTSFLYSFIAKLEEAGVKVFTDSSGLTVDASDSSLAAVDVTTGVFPGFPTDLQAQWTALMTVAQGTCTVTDTIYFDRFKHVPELVRLGADISTKENSVIIKGKKRLHGAKVMSTDLRASASLVLAGLVAEGETEVLRVYHLDRGYEKLEAKLSLLGARIERIAGTEF